MRALPLAALLSFATATACAAPAGGAPTLEATDAYLLAPPTPASAAAYLTVHNRGAAADTLLGAEASWAETVMLHRTMEVEGFTRMVHEEQVMVGQRDSLVLRPGGLHLMLVGLAALPQVGDSLPLTLMLARAGRVETVLVVRGYGQQ